MKNFAGIADRFADIYNSRITLQSIPYDGTSTWGKGADKGFEAFMDAAENMELYDIETRSEVYKRGIHTLPPIEENSSPEAMFQAVYESTQEVLKLNKFPTFFGGEHSVSIGIIKAFYEKWPGISILQIDAHTDLRPEYMGTPYNHACAVYDASQNAHLVQVGIRSMDKAELEFVNKDTCFYASDIINGTNWVSEVVECLNDKVYITFDLDAFDPSIMPATGTPEPGGLTWYPVLKLLKEVFRQKEVVGFDIVELAPIDGLTAPQFLAAKLYYKMLSYKFELK